MSDNLAVFRNEILPGLNKGTLKDLGNGYKEITVGAFNCYSLKNEFYEFTKEMVSLFEDNSMFMHLVRSGRLRGENDHPYPNGNMTRDEFLNRMLTIDGKNEACAFNSMRLVEAKDDKNKRIILVKAGVTGSGVHMDAMNRRLSNSEENIDFSGRFVNHMPRINSDGRLVRRPKLVVTYDVVPIGGMKDANKYDSISMESALPFDLPEDEGMVFNQQMLDAAQRLHELNNGITSMESNQLVSTTMVKDQLGWNKVELITPRSFINW